MIGLNSAWARHAAGAAAAALAVTSLSVAASAPANAADPTTKVRITKSNKVRMDTDLRPGLRRFKVRSAEFASFQIVRPDAGYSKEDLARDVADGFEGDARAFKRFERNTTLIGGVSSAPGEPGLLWTKLRRGTYWAFDTAPNRFLARNMRTIHVTGDSNGGRLPSSATLTADGGTSFADDPTSMPASGVVRLRNESGKNHFYGIAALKPGKTIADVDAWVEGLQNGEEGPPPMRFNTGFESGVVSPGKSMAMSYDLPPGDYVLLCFWPMPNHDFMPHFFMGMYRGITLS